MIYCINFTITAEGVEITGNITDFYDEITLTSPIASSAWNGNTGQYGADNALDGNTDGDISNGGCVFTGK